MFRSQNQTNTNQFSRKYGWNVELIAVDKTKLWRDCVSNKELANEKEKKGCARGLSLGENLWNKRKREKNFRDRTKFNAHNLCYVSS